MKRSNSEFELFDEDLGVYSQNCEFIFPLLFFDVCWPLSYLTSHSFSRSDRALVRPTKIMKLSNSRQCQSFELDLSGSVEHNVQLLTGLSPFYANVVSLNLAFCNYVSGTDVLTLLSSQEERMLISLSA